MGEINARYRPGVCTIESLYRLMARSPVLPLPGGLLEGVNRRGCFLHILVYLVIHDSGKVSLKHLLLSWYPFPVDVMNENLLSQPTPSLSPGKVMVLSPVVPLLH